MAAIEHEMMRTSLQTTSTSSAASFIPSGATPVGADGMPTSKANEFWFPDCRDCPCCKGYKYGCACMATGVVECCDMDCGAPTGGEAYTALSGASTGRGLSGTAQPYTGGARTGASMTRYAPTRAMCRYFINKALCRLNVEATNMSSLSFRNDTRCVNRGKGCPFRHTPCKHFFSSGCREGDRCIFSHSANDNVVT